MNPCIVKSILRLVCGFLSLGILAGTTGCANNPHGTKHAEVSGKVLFKSKPLPGGQVTFIAVKGGFPSSAPIDENGNYQIDAPIGEVQIGVDNRMFEPKRGAPAREMRRPKGEDSQEEAKEAKPMKGRYVDIPERYADPATSGLTYTVKPEPQTHNIELSDNPLPPPGAAGP